MKKIIITALTLLAVTATTASAQYGGWRRDEHPYERRHHAFCFEKSKRLHDYERRSARDGFISPRERMTIRALEADLARTCRGHRHSH
jgi:hypothetical protein